MRAGFFGMIGLSFVVFGCASRSNNETDSNVTAGASALGGPIGVSAGSMFGSGTVSVDLMQSVSKSPAGETFDAAWRSFVTESQFEADNNRRTSAANFTEYQESCKPRRYLPPSNVAYKGTIFLIHGFTACPQQYFDIAEAAAKKGWIVALPLLPGHGYSAFSKPGQSLSDNYNFLPNGSAAYSRFITRINEVAATAAGTRVIGGLSLGGALAFGAVMSKPDLYSRAIFLAPFFDMASGLAAKMVRLLDSDQMFSWDKGEASKPCEKGNGSLGRAGYCQMRYNNLRAVLDTGKGALKAAQKVGTKLQFFGIDADSSANTPAIANAAAAVGGASASVGACFYSGAVPHSMISKYEMPVEKPWLPTLNTAIVKYLDDGTLFSASSEVSKVAPIPYCAPKF